MRQTFKRKGKPIPSNIFCFKMFNRGWVEFGSRVLGFLMSKISGCVPISPIYQERTDEKYCETLMTVTLTHVGKYMFLLPSFKMFLHLQVPFICCMLMKIFFLISLKFMIFKVQYI